MENHTLNVKLAQRDPVSHTLGALPLSLGERDGERETGMMFHYQG